MYSYPIAVILTNTNDDTNDTNIKMPCAFHSNLSIAIPSHTQAMLHNLRFQGDSHDPDLTANNHGSES